MSKVLSEKLAGVNMGQFSSHPNMGLRTLKRSVGLAFFLELFYLIGHYMWKWPFPTPMVIFEIFITVGLGTLLGIVFSRIWPLPPRKGFERIMRTLLVGIPALGIGIGLQVLIQGANPTQALYMVFTLAAWFGSFHYVRIETPEETAEYEEREKKRKKKQI